MARPQLFDVAGVNEDSMSVKQGQVDGSLYAHLTMECGPMADRPSSGRDAAGKFQSSWTTQALAEGRDTCARPLVQHGVHDGQRGWPLGHTEADVRSSATTLPLADGRRFSDSGVLRRQQVDYGAAGLAPPPTPASSSDYDDVNRRWLYSRGSTGIWTNPTAQLPAGHQDSSAQQRGTDGVRTATSVPTQGHYVNNVHLQRSDGRVSADVKPSSVVPVPVGNHHDSYGICEVRHEQADHFEPQHGFRHVDKGSAGSSDESTLPLQTQVRDDEVQRSRQRGRTNDDQSARADLIKTSVVIDLVNGLTFRLVE